MTLTEIFKRFRPGFTLAMSLVIVEKLANIVEPMFLGRLIDALIGFFQTQTHASYFLPLTFWGAVYLVNSGIGSIRRSVDPKIYLRVYTSIAVHIAESCRINGVTNSKAAARTELSREYISFLQSRIPDIIEAIFDLGGTMVALAFYDIRISLTCLAAAVPMALVYHLYNSKVVRLQKEFHDSREDLFAVYQEKEIQDIRKYHDHMALSQMRIANWGAFNFGLLRVVLLGIFLVVLYLSIAIDRLSAGQIYSVVSYLWTFITATEFLPDLLESYTSLKDIQNRIRVEAAPRRKKSRE